MAQETGIFKKHGLDVQLIYIPSSGTNIHVLLGGSLDVSPPGISGAVLAAARGAPVLAIAAMTNRPAMTLYVQPKITRGDQLKGQTLGISRFNSTGHTVTTLILRKLGVEKSATMRPLGGTPEMQAAFEQKQVAGIVTGVKPGALRASAAECCGPGHPLCHECHGGHSGLSAKEPRYCGTRGQSLHRSSRRDE